MKKICTIYRSSKKEGMYLYVDKTEDLSRVPNTLLKTFGKPEQAMTLVLHEQRKLARVDVKQVMSAISNDGYFLQMPPKLDVVLEKIQQQNSKLY